MKFNWNTEKGAKIEIEITEEKVKVNNTINADGDKVTTEKLKWEYTLNSLKVNGQEFKGEYNYSNITFKMGGRIATIIIPENIRKQIAAGWFAEAENKMKVETEFENGRRKINEAMNY